MTIPVWLSDIAFIGEVPAMWQESAVLALRRLITGLTDCMFEPDPIAER